jgi:hypothetical protein
MAYLIPSPTAFPTVPNYSSYAGVTGFKMSVPTTTSLTLSPGYARASTNDYAITYPTNQPNVPSVITINTNVTGPNGCYPVPLSQTGITSPTVFGVYVIARSSGTTDGSLNNAITTAAVIATGNNFLPPGYDVYRRIGLVYVNNAGFVIIPWIQTGDDNERLYTLQNGVAELAAGAAIAYTTVDLTSAAGVIPPNKTTNVTFLASLVANAAGGYFQLKPSSIPASGASPIQIVNNVATIAAASNIVCAVSGNASLNGDASIDYLVDNAGSNLTLSVAAFSDSLGTQLF